MSMWGIKASMPLGKTHMAVRLPYVPSVDFIVHMYQ